MLPRLELHYSTELYDSSGDGLAGQKIRVPAINSLFTRARDNRHCPHYPYRELPAHIPTSIIVFQTSSPTSRVKRLSGPIGGASLRHCLLSEVPNYRADIATT
jgi:hypothetical protein